jgi:2-keto-4-pentenoate hydratase
MTAFTDRLAIARLEGTTVSPSEAEGPSDAAAAYAMQAEVFAHLGPRSNAWKVGSTSPQSQAKLGTTEPGSARVPARFSFTSGAPVPVFAAHDLWVEGEFALRLGKDLPPRGPAYSRAEVEAAIDGVAPALEIVGSRLAEGIAKGGRFRVTADGGANVSLTTGAVIGDWRCFDLPAHQVRLSINGEEAAVGIGERALGDPVNVMLWLANHLRGSEGLKAGEIVSTGTCTGLIRVRPGDLLRADFGEIGIVEVPLTDARGA